MSTIRPVPLGRITGRKPAAVRRSATRRVVRCSALASSGWACRSRRNAISSSSCLARNAFRSAARSFPSMPGTPLYAEPIVGELRDEGVYHADQVPCARVDGPLPFVRGAPFEHLEGHRELLEAAQPRSYRLQLTEQFVKFVAERRGGAGLISDHDRVQPVSRRAPLVVPDYPGRRGRQRIAA